MTDLGFRMEGSAPRRRSLWHFMLAFVLVLGAGAFGLSRLLAGPADYGATEAGDPVVVVVQEGDSLSAIGNTLLEADVVASLEAFVQASDANPRSRYITPGDYRLPTRIPADRAVALLLEPASRDEVRIVIPEGMRAEAVFQRVAKALGRDVDEVRQAFRATNLPPSADGNVEGYLFPATYGVARSATPAEVAARMVDRFRTAAAELELERRARALQLPVRDVVIIASLVEQEAAPADYAKVARVVLNRLALGMPLQFDSTVNYGLGTKDLRLSQAQLQRDTPYNTYLRTGLPPTPIGNPGAAALEAALSPAPGDWLYFVTTDVKRGTTEFATSYDEFLRLKAKFQRNN